MVFLVEINQFRSDGQLACAEIFALTTSFQCEDQAVEWTLNDEDIDNVRDVTVEALSNRTDCWFQSGPESMQ